MFPRDSQKAPHKASVGLQIARATYSDAESVLMWHLPRIFSNEKGSQAPFMAAVCLWVLCAAEEPTGKGTLKEQSGGVAALAVFSRVSICRLERRAHGEYQ